MVAGAVPGDVDDPAAGGLDGLQSAGLERRQRVLLQAEAEPSFPCHAVTHAGWVTSWLPHQFRRNAGGWQQAGSVRLPAAWVRVAEVLAGPGSSIAVEIVPVTPIGIEAVRAQGGEGAEGFVEPGDGLQHVGGLVFQLDGEVEHLRCPVLRAIVDDCHRRCMQLQQAGADFGRLWNIAKTQFAVMFGDRFTVG